LRDPIAIQAARLPEMAFNQVVSAVDAEIQRAFEEALAAKGSLQ